MIDVKDSMIKRVIAIRFLEEELRKDGIFPEREDLNFYDVVSPKLLALLGTNECLLIYQGKDLNESFKERGLSIEEKQNLEITLKNAFLSYNQNGLSKEFEDAINQDFIKYINKVSKHLYDSNNSFELDLLNEAMKNSFENSKSVYTPCSVYENSKQNIVK